MKGGAHPWRDAPSYEDAMNVNNSRRIPQTTPELTPYLGVRSRLSQVWFNRWTVLLLLIMVRVILATVSLDSDLESARDKAFSACTGVESMGTAMASMPFYMANGVNEMAAKGIESAIRALEATLLLMITGVQEMVVFIVNLITSTYVCLITLAVRGSVGVMVDALKEITDFVNNAMTDIFNSVDGQVQTIEDGINKVTSFLESIPNFLGGGVDIPDVNLPALDKLKDGLTIPDDFKQKLDDMENSIPTFEEVKEAAGDAIRIPFQLLLNKVNSTLGIYEFDRSVFPVPAKEKLTFCTDNPSINNFFDNLKDLVFKVKNILVGVIIALALLVMIPMGYREWHSFRTTRRHAFLLSDPIRAFDPVDVVHIASHPNSSVFSLRISKFSKSNRRQTLIRWAVSYVTSPAALFVLSLGVAGLFSVACQMILLKQVEARTPGLAEEIGEFAGMVVDKLENASKQWAIGANQALNTTNAELNDELFGWVKEGTDSLNDTLNTFVDTMHDGVDSFFKDTPLAAVINEVLNCLVTIKIQGIQKGLTWANEHAQITFPTLPEDAFSRGALESIGSDSDPASSFLSNPGSAATDQITDVVVKLTNKWESSIKQEAMISAAILGVWVVVCIIALIRTACLWFGRELVRGEGGAAPLPQPHLFTGGISDGQGVYGKYQTQTQQPNFPTFGPTPTTPNGPPSPEEYPNEKSAHIQMGTVNSGLPYPTEPSEGTPGNRESFHPRVYYKRSV
ncbi:hypothetical protein BZA05DRAFT_333504 [Tricharina praecox]|uniref:uncharacterized protein n=1 Tax=Tricharina praecox TaxID=43433 RepID=UPI00221E7C3C|nr:uncharacterized protein BZA05DRAFT_333504 [Tricharina praecox]KAI5855801.1 hypothetical protein BZA05DRAFT_333504 [Tricharina praecox]